MTKDKQTQIKSGGCYQSLPACAWPHALIHVVQRPGSWTSSRANGNDGRMMEPLRRSSIPFLGDSADSLRYPRNPRNYFPIGTRPGCISGGKDMFPVVPWPNLPPPKKKHIPNKLHPNTLVDIYLKTMTYRRRSQSFDVPTELKSCKASCQAVLQSSLVLTLSSTKLWRFNRPFACSDSQLGDLYYTTCWPPCFSLIKFAPLFQCVPFGWGSNCRRWH